WKKLDLSEPKPTPRSGFQFIAHPTSDFIILHGGYAKQYTKGQKTRGITYSDTWALKMSTDEKTIRWERRKKGGISPSLRSGSTMAGFKNRAVMFGGVTDIEEDDERLESLCHNDLFIYTLENNKWFPLSLRQPKDKSKKSKPLMIEKYDSDKDESQEESNDEDESENTSKNKITKSSIDSDSTTRPCPRFNAMMAVQKNNLFIFGGILEESNREYTLNDMWSLNLEKANEFECLKSEDLSEIGWLGENSGGESDDDEDEDSNESSNDEDGDEDEDSDEKKDEKEPEANPIPEAPKKSAPEEEPHVNETLKDYFVRTGTFWQMKAMEELESTQVGKSLRKDAFQICQDNWTLWQPRLLILAKMQEEEEAGDISGKRAGGAGAGNGFDMNNREREDRRDNVVSKNYRNQRIVGASGNQSFFGNDNEYNHWNSPSERKKNNTQRDNTRIVHDPKSNQQRNYQNNPKNHPKKFYNQQQAEKRNSLPPKTASSLENIKVLSLEQIMEKKNNKNLKDENSSNIAPAADDNRNSDKGKVYKNKIDNSEYADNSQVVTLLQPDPIVFKELDDAIELKGDDEIQPVSIVKSPHSDQRQPAKNSSHQVISTSKSILNGQKEIKEKTEENPFVGKVNEEEKIIIETSIIQPVSPPITNKITSSSISETRNLYSSDRARTFSNGSHIEVGEIPEIATSEVVISTTVNKANSDRKQSEYQPRKRLALSDEEGQVKKQKQEKATSSAILLEDIDIPKKVISALSRKNLPLFSQTQDFDPTVFEKNITQPGISLQDALKYIEELFSQSRKTRNSSSAKIFQMCKILIRQAKIERNFLVVISVGDLMTENGLNPDDCVFLVREYCQALSPKDLDLNLNKLFRNTQKKITVFSPAHYSNMFIAINSEKLRCVVEVVVKFFLADLKRQLDEDSTEILNKVWGGKDGNSLVNRLCDYLLTFEMTDVAVQLVFLVSSLDENVGGNCFVNENLVRRLLRECIEQYSVKNALKLVKLMAVRKISIDGQILALLFERACCDPSHS
ncbi:hypothetical protein HK096_003116, partial [Nowakowskiella sp. JEL0078]